MSESNIVNEVQFGETSAGAAMLQGTFVGADQSHARASGGSFKRGEGMDSREVRDANGLYSANTKSRILIADWVLSEKENATSTSWQLLCTSRLPPPTRLSRYSS